MDTTTLTAAPDTASCFSDTPPPHAERTGAQLDEQELIVKYLYLVKIAVDRLKRTLPAHICADDLYSVGVSGLISAVGKFNPVTERTFPGFANMRIRGAMLDELRQMDFCSRRTRVRTREFEAQVNAVEQRIGRTATAHEICTALGLSQKEYFKRVEEAKPIRILALDSVSEPSEGSGTSLYNLLADANDETGREQLEKAELLEMLAQHLARLPEMQRKILSMYYFENLRFSAIAAAFNLTESRISQIHQATIQGLRKWIKAARER